MAKITLSARNSARKHSLKTEIGKQFYQLIDGCRSIDPRDLNEKLIGRMGDTRASISTYFAKRAVLLARHVAQSTDLKGCSPKIRSAAHEVVTAASAFEKRPSTRQFRKSIDSFHELANLIDPTHQAWLAFALGVFPFSVVIPKGPLA